MSRSRKLVWQGGLALVVWTVFVAFLYRDTMANNRASIHEMAVVEARVTFEKDRTYRRWVSLLGGLYVPVGELVQPNPYLKVKNRDVETTDGTRLTLINPAYMTRMVYEIMSEEAGLQAHITSLDPINPVNAPDDWERKALEKFEKGELESHDYFVKDGEPVLYFMRAMVTEEHCLRCHEEQGYTVGSIRGGISVAVPMKQYDAALSAFETEALRRYGLIWTSGFGFIGFGFMTLLREERSRRKAERDQQDAAKRLAESEEFLKSLYDNSPMGIFVLDVSPDGRPGFVGVNAAFARMTGMVGGGGKTGDFGSMFPPQELVFMNSLLAECIETGESRELEHQVMHPDGGKWWLLRVTPLAGQDGRVWRLIGNAMPITSWKQAEEALRTARDQAEMASRTKSGFLANMSHEIRTPLNGVMGMLQLMQCTKLTSEQDEYVRIALTSSSRLTRLLSDILDISRIESGKLILHETRFKLAAVRDAVMDIFRHGIADGNLEVRFDIDEGTPDTLVGDEARLLQILFNLVGNAIKFTPAHGRVDIRVISLPSAPGRARLLFVVSDTGIGIPEERLREVFEPFVQVENSYTRRFQGAGLGLAIVGRLVSLMNGSLNFDSIENEGTIVSLVLPFGTEAKAGLSEVNRPVPPRKSGDGRRILLAEDDDVNRLAGRRIMEKCGYRVDVAKDGREAVSQVEANDYDLILMDIQMPVMDGVEACARIRAMGGAKSMVPIIAMTAYAQNGDREKFLAAGMNGYLAKPVRMEEMQALVRRVLDRDGRDSACCGAEKEREMTCCPDNEPASPIPGQPALKRADEGERP